MNSRIPTNTSENGGGEIAGHNRCGWHVKTAWTSDALSFDVFLLDHRRAEGVVERHITDQHRV